MVLLHFSLGTHLLMTNHSVKSTILEVGRLCLYSAFSSTRSMKPHGSGAYWQLTYSFGCFTWS